MISRSLTFQSTPSAWRETNECPKIIANFCISIHSLRMEGDDKYTGTHYVSDFISIHSLRMEGDPSMLVIYNR